MIRSGLIATCLAAALGFASALLLASCGGSDAKLLSGTTAEEITSNLSSVRELAAEGDCVGARDAALEVSGQISDLHEVDPKLKLALQEGAERLNEVVSTCTEETTAPEETEEEPTTTETEPSKEQQKEEQKAQKEEENAQKEEEKQEEQEQKELEKEENAQEAEEGPPFGEAKGHEEHGPPPAPEPPSGGIGPSGEAGD